MRTNSCEIDLIYEEKADRDTKSNLTRET